MTHRVPVKETLWEQGDKAQTYLDIAGVMFITIGRHGTVTLINKKGCEILGCTEDEILGKNWFRTFLPESMRESVEGVFNRLMAGEIAPVEYYENPVLTRSGEERVIAWHNTILKDGDGGIIGSLSSGEDVTERIKAEEERSRADNVIRVQRDLAVALNSVTGLDAGLRLCIQAGLAVSGMDDGGVYLVDKKSSSIELASYIGYASPRFIERVSRYDCSSLRGRIVMEGIPRYAEFTKLGEPLDEAERAERIRAVAVIPIHHESCVIGCLNVISRTLYEVPDFARDALESIAAQMGGAIARLRGVDDLRESERRYRTLFDSANDAILLIEGGRFVDCNAKTVEMFGCAREEILGQSPCEFSPEEQPDGRDSGTASLDKIGEALKGMPQHFEWRHRRRDGTLFDAEVSLTHLDVGGKRYILAVVRDVTERKRAELELQESCRKLRESLWSTASSLASALETRDPYTAGHQQRVTRLACAIAEEMGLTDDQIEGIRVAGSLHDIGKISVPSEILSKPGRLSEIEFSFIRNHPQAGYEIVKNIDFPWPVARMVLQHHERMDGSGYPRGLKGEEIVLEARILAVADVIEAMASHRPYRPALGIEAALDEISKNRGILYDPQVVDVCMRLFPKSVSAFEDFLREHAIEMKAAA